MGHWARAMSTRIMGVVSFVMISMLILSFLPGSAALAEESDETAGDGAPAPLHFRLEAWTGEMVTMMGRLQASEGVRDTYDQAVLDMDGDGRPEKTIPVTRSPNAVSVPLDAEDAAAVYIQPCGAVLYGFQALGIGVAEKEGACISSE